VDSKWHQETGQYTCSGWQKVNQQKTCTQHKKDPPPPKKKKSFKKPAKFVIL
jgi:hypothetical protein